MQKWIDAADFSPRGEWKLDTQFTHLMGSPYLLACHEPGRPCADATARFCWNGGKARLWVRTRNWYHPDSPGQFSLFVNGKESRVLGTMPTHDWYWEIAGDLDLKNGENEVILHDLTGYFGRLAAIFITDDMDLVPPRPVSEYKAFRAAATGVDLTPREIGEFDVIVAGAGPGGVPAAVSAARNGAKVLLISGRPVIGGNASSEAGVGFNGASARQYNAREGGIAEEIVRTNAYKRKNWQKVLEELCAHESNLTVITGWFVSGAEAENGRITSLTAENIFDNSRICAKAAQFIDCTGDAWLGYFAGAKYRIGREAYWQYGEPFAPAEADTLTMSGCTMSGYGDPSIPPMYEKTDAPVAYEAPSWVPRFPAGKACGRNIERVGFAWWVEAPNNFDDIYDAEMVRDELFRIQLGHYNYLKNLWDDKEKAKNYRLAFLPYYDAKRESRRLVGDYVLTQNDCMEGRDFSDTVSHTGWPIDLHNPKGLYSGEEGPFFSNTHVPLVKVPFRALYSANIKNLLFAGRLASVSHVALGTARVENTIACMGQAVGTAAAMCSKLGVDPRALGEDHLEAFRNQLLKDDQFIPGLQSTDSSDLARSATVTASSYKPFEELYAHIGDEREGYELICERATFFARGIPDDIPSVWTLLENRTEEERTVTFHVRLQADPDGYTTKDDAAVVRVILPAKSKAWYELPLNLHTPLRYLWMWTETCPGVWWPIWKASALDHTRSERSPGETLFPNMRNETHCVLIEAPKMMCASCHPENVINGYSRTVDAENHAWVSDPEKGLPAHLELTLREKAAIHEIRLTFDTDMTNPAMLSPYEPFPHQLVKAYTLEVYDGEKWQTVAGEKDNFLRHRIHSFPEMHAEKVRLTVTDSGDHQTARLFEIRIY
ncbi:MAG: FAD-dependent oxidoreductase [Clostridia bacterium]|nr:FAD-dependent oxidoreductase [Clostridia bacterium]